MLDDERVHRNHAPAVEPGPGHLLEAARPLAANSMKPCASPSQPNWGMLLDSSGSTGRKPTMPSSVLPWSVAAPLQRPSINSKARPLPAGARGPGTPLQATPRGSLLPPSPLPYAPVQPPAPSPAHRAYSSTPENVVYAGPSAPNPARVTLRTLRKKYDAKQPLTMLTAYDYPSAVHVDQASADILLVGDSVGMVVHGHDTTLPVTLDDMLMHCRWECMAAREDGVHTSRPRTTPVS